MARFRSVEIGVLLAALVAGASAWLVGCEPSRSSSSRKENASQVDNIRKDESDSSADRGSGAVTASAAPSKTEEAARPEPSRAEGENKSDSPKGDGKENKDEDGGIVVRDAKTGKAVTGFKIEKLDPNKKRVIKKRVIPPNPIPQPDPNPSSIEGLKAVTTESGLKYWDIKVGEGEVPHEQAMVKIDYRCWLADGTMADSAWQQRWYPTYQKPGTIAGLAESIWSMREGGIRQVIIPPELGFGESGFPRKGDGPKMIPPNAELTFETKLMKVLQPPKQTSVEGLESKLTGSGVKYWDIKIGSGDTVEAKSDVKARFTGWVKGGKMFMTTEFAKQSRNFALWSSHVIGGLRHGLPGMRVGGKRRIEIPPELARSPAFPADSTLIFEVQIMETTLRPDMPTPSSVLGLKPKTTASGLTLWDIVEGAGPVPEPTSTVSVYYTIWLDDGAIQATSEFSGHPMRSPVSRFFEGFRETIVTMKVGGIRQARVPPNLAFGEKGQPPETPPNATLIVEVQLVEVE